MKFSEGLQTKPNFLEVWSEQMDKHVTSEKLLSISEYE